MSTHDRVARARDYLAAAFAELDAIEGGLDPLTSYITSTVRGDVQRLGRRLGALLTTTTTTTEGNAT